MKAVADTLAVARSSCLVRRQLLGCDLDVAVEEVDLRSQHVGEACSAFVDVVVAAGAAEQFGPRSLAGDFERGRDGRDTVCLGKYEQQGIVPWRPVLRGHELLSERAVRRGADGQVPGPSVTSDVDRLAAKKGADAVEQGQSEELGPILGFGHHRCGQAVGTWRLGDRCGQPIVTDSELEDVHAGEGRAPR